MSVAQDTIAQKKAWLGAALAEPMQRLADACAEAWFMPDRLDGALADNIHEVPGCHLVYALETDGIQHSANVWHDRIEADWRGQDLSHRPYVLGASLPYRGFVLSAAYLSARGREPCITAVQAVRAGDQLLGFAAADFNIRDLPQLESVAPESAPAWRQFRGDPAIRGMLFEQRRALSLMDEHIDTVIAILESLMRDQGVFHGKLHFSSARLTVWHVDDPFSYRLHAGPEITEAELCLAYPHRAYPARARVAPDHIRLVLEQFRTLRQADDTVYLRSGSLNVINGMVGLTFSCDGSHYMPVDEFLERDVGFWLGAA